MNLDTQNNSVTLTQLQHIVDEWITTIGKGYFSPLTNMAVLTEETGEVARIMARDFGDQTPKPHDSGSLADELADVIWVVAALANQTGIDLNDAFLNNLKKKNQRDSKRFK